MNECWDNELSWPNEAMTQPTQAPTLAEAAKAIEWLSWRLNRMISKGGYYADDDELDRLDEIDALATRLQAQQPEAEAWFEAWAILENGELSDKDETGIGTIHGVEFEWIREIYDNGELWCYMEQVEIDPPANAIVVNFRVSNLSAQEGQQSFPETGQWDFPPHTEMDVEVIGYDIVPPQPIDLADPETLQLSGADVEIPF